MGKTAVCKRLEYENKYYQLGYDNIIGVDEAGRGPMAGELVVAGVVFKPGFYDERINDSKQLSSKKREFLYDLIIENALCYHIEVLSVEDVDKLNVYQASKLGMLRCVEALTAGNTFVLSDAMPLGDIDHLAIIKGDALSLSIGAASILAKVTRDRLMTQHALTYPNYKFEKHKGYATKLHKELLDEYGVCPIHRRTFKPVSDRLEKQLSLDI